MAEIIATIAVCAAIPIAAAILYSAQRPISKYRSLPNALQPTKRVRASAIISACVFYAATVISSVACICAHAANGAVYICLVLFGLFTIGFGAAAFEGHFACTVVDDDRIVSVSVFLKTKSIPYEQIAFYSDDAYRAHPKFGNNAILGVYAANGDKLFTLETDIALLHIFTDKADKLGIPLTAYPTPELANSAEFKTNSTRKKRKISAVTFLIIGILYFGLFGLIFGLNMPRVFVNSPASGVVESVDGGGTSNKITFTLENDPVPYIISDISLEVSNSAVTSALKKGATVSVLVAYESNGSRYVSQMEIDGKTYLTASDVEREYKRNKRLAHIYAYVFLGIGAVSVCYSIGVYIRLKRTARRPQ